MTECRVYAVLKPLASHQCGSGSIPNFTPHVGWDCCWLSTLLLGFFLFVLRVLPSVKNSNSTCIPRTKDKSRYFLCHLLEKIEGCWFFSRFNSIAPHHCFGIWYLWCFSVFHSTDSISQIKRLQWDFGIKNCPKNVLARPNNSGPGSSLWPWHALRSPFREADSWENIMVSGSSGSGR